MLYFDWFKNLIPYFQFSQQALNEKNIFLVGWVIRDIFLNIQKDDFKDIDITLAKDPWKLYDWINKNSWSIFKTDKFWTITIVDKKKSCQYEITPFREEWTYSDNRHPDELKWTKNLISDSWRRDFTINCMYYSYFENNWENSDRDVFYYENKGFFLKSLKRNWYGFLKNNILIVQNQEIIDKILEDWRIKKQEILKIVGDCWNLHIIFDPHCWFNDLIYNKIRAVWNSDDRIKEDALRIIRAIRFVSILNCYENVNFDFDSKTWISLKKYYFFVRKIAKERINQEIKKVFDKWNAFGFVSLMDELNILKYLFPSVYNLKNVKQPNRYHPFDSFTHTLLTLYHLQQINSNYLVRLSMLYHDVWKQDQYYRAGIKKDEESQKELYKIDINHPIIWAELTWEDLKKLWFSKKEINDVIFYVYYHMFPWELIFMSERKQQKEIKKFISEFGIEKLLNLCDITIWDRLWQYNPLQHKNINWIFDLKKKINTIYKEIWRITLKDLKINWNDVVKILWYTWPQVWNVLNRLLDFVLEDVKRNKKTILIKKAKEIILKNK